MRKPLFLLIVSLLLAAPAQAANRYWVGGTATWDGTAGTKWSTTSGGAGGSAVPTASDDVFFDANSGSGTTTVSASRVCRSINFTGYTGTLSGVSSGRITVGTSTVGHVTIVAGMTLNTTVNWTFAGTTGTNNITTAGKNMGSTTFSGTGATWSFADAFTASSISHTAGTINTNGQTVTLTGSITSSGTTTRTLTFGASTLNLGGFNCSGSNLTVNANTSTINLSSSSFGVTFNGLAKTYNIVTMTSGTEFRRSFNGSSIDGGNTFASLTFTGGNTKAANLSLSGNNTITGALTINGNSITNRVHVYSSVRGTARTLTAGSVSLSYVDFEDITASGAAAPFTGTSIGDCGGNTSITPTAAVTRYWVGDGGSWSDTAHWSTSSGGSTGASVPLAHDTVNFDASSFSSGSQTVTLDMHRYPGFNCTGIDNDPAFSFGVDDSMIFGTITLASGMTTTESLAIGIPDIELVSHGAATLTNAGVAWAIPLLIGCAPGSSITLQDALVVSGSSFTVTSGTFDANDQNVTVQAFASSNSNTRTISMGNGTWTVNGTGASATLWNTGTTTGLTFNCESSTIKVAGFNPTGSARTFAGGGLTYNIVEMTNLESGVGALTISGSNTFAALTLPGDPLGARSNISISGSNTITNWTVGAPRDVLSFPGTTTQTVTNMTIGSTSDACARVIASVGTALNIVVSGTVSVDNFDVDSATVTGASSPITNRGGEDFGGNSGITFVAGSACGAFISSD